LKVAKANIAKKGSANSTAHKVDFDTPDPRPKRTGTGAAIRIDATFISDRPYNHFPKNRQRLSSRPAASCPFSGESTVALNGSHLIDNTRF
jgi:hypothetical protein